MNHIVDIHSTKHTCLSCKEVFPSKGDMIKHAGDVHGLKYNLNEGNNFKISCHDCEEICSTKHELYNHKKEKHYKKRLCSYYHGNGWGCRFPDRCLNIHNENITPELTDDNRGKIPCSYGDSCYYFSRNNCHYKHTQNYSAPSAPPLETEDIQWLPRMKCVQCSYETNTKIELDYHIELQHGARPKDYRGIQVTGYPVGHAQWAASRNRAEYKCKECTSEFTIESMLRKHISREHNTNFSKNCTKCSKLFNSNEELVQHVKLTHINDTNVETTLNKICNQMNTISDRLNSLEQSSLTNFPNLPTPMGRQ